MSAPPDRGPRDLSGAPEPLVPVDLDFPPSNVMPVDRRWVQDPVRRATWRSEDWLVALTLRAASLDQAPPASLPSDDVALAALAGWVDDWPGSRDRVLDDWVLCSDGRLYQPEIAAWVLELWLAFDAEDRAVGVGAAEEDRLDAQRHFDRLQQLFDAAQASANPGRH